MTQDEIIEMATESNLLGVIDSFHYDTKNWVEEATAFAKLVAAKERLDCFDAAYQAYATTEVLKAIRARGEA